MPNRGRCDNCKRERNLTYWVGEGGAMDYVHGYYKMWCEACQLRSQIEYAEKIAARLPDLRAQLRSADSQ